MALAPGAYAVDRTAAGYPLSNVKGAETVAVKAGQWTRLNGLTSVQCPDSGVYGWDYRACSGPVLSGRYQCASAIDPDTRRTIATADCAMAVPTFVLPLPPRRYRVKLAHWPEQDAVVVAGKWMRLGLLNATPCPPIP
jgi:hypothetical protein